MALRSFTFLTRTSTHLLFKNLIYPSISCPSFLTHYLFAPFSTHPLSFQPPPPSSSSPSSPPELVNDLSRILSDFRDPRHDIISALTPFSSHISSDLVDQVLKRCKNLGFSAHRFFLWAKQLPGFVHSNDSYCILLDILGSSKQFPLIWDFLLEIRDNKSFEINNKIFWIVFRAYVRADLPVDAVRAFNKMVDFGLKPGTDDLDHLLYLLCKRKLVKHAQQLFDKMKHEIPPTIKTYTILVRGWGYIGESSEAQRVFDEMIARGCLVDIHAYNSVLESLCKGGNIDEAYKLFQSMRSKGIEPDAFTYSIFILASCEANDIHTAFRILDRTKRYNLVPNVFTYNCVINKLCKSDRVDEAYQLLDEMFERGLKPDVWCYNAILAFHCNRSEVNMAHKLFSRMHKDSCEADKHTYNMLLKMLIRIGRFDRVAKVWENMEGRGFHPSVSTYSVMIHGYCNKKGKLEEACKYFEMMVDDGIPPYPSTCEALRNRLVGLGFSEQVEILADKMERSTSCSIQEMSSIMRGKKKNVRLRRQEDSSEYSD